MKSCSNPKCWMTNPQPNDHFSKNNHSKDGLNYKCKACIKEYNSNNKHKIKLKNKRWKNANPENRKKYEIRKSYGVTWDQYKAMLLKQNNCCAICNTALNKPNIDHCHKTGKVRGLLCGECNRGLGVFKDDINLLNNAINYLTVVE